MTTSHRPQLEARSGGKYAPEQVPTGAKHARLLPGHTKIKRRKVKPATSDASSLVSGAREIIKTDKVDFDEENNSNNDRESSEDDEYDSTYSSSSDDEEELREGLEAIRRARELNESHQKLAVEASSVQEPKQVSAVKSWRSNTVFGAQKKSNGDSQVTAENRLKYLNDLSRSEYHRDFMKRVSR
ncbi:HBR092Wp [Eremothecium sinecaudum]|uniref:Pre-mRNA-splicing factor CWC15 n=1 Tax=Eremothecium sinecaudum TaxID=45286 RepID=A0A109UWS4_9SACH|nr:HBR092Wp [Eremothecium sinecaudum]AMD18993.1 HBR092Wp [Eremothecium sinecaudum]